MSHNKALYKSTDTSLYFTRSSRAATARRRRAPVCEMAGDRYRVTNWQH